MCRTALRTVKSTRQMAAFQHSFQLLASCTISFSSNNPGSNVPDFSRLSIYCDGQIRSLLKNSSPNVSLCTTSNRHGAPKYHGEYFRITKSNPRQTFIFHMHVLVPHDIFESNLSLMQARHQYLNFLKNHTGSRSSPRNKFFSWSKICYLNLNFYIYYRQT